MTTTELTAQSGESAMPPRRSIATRIVNRATVEDACKAVRVDMGNITNNYSGPVMHGATCFAVSVDRDKLVPFLLALGGGLAHDDSGCDKSFPTTPVNNIADATCTENTPLGMTVYFPGWSLTPRPRAAQSTDSHSGDELA
jgi:hypothetical protein